jgi:hypothetical protein
MNVKQLHDFLHDQLDMFGSAPVVVRVLHEGTGHDFELEMPQRVIANDGLVKFVSRMSVLDTNAPNGKTWTADELRDLVMDYSEGCQRGKIDFLRYLGIPVERWIKATFLIEVGENSPADAIDELVSDVQSATHRVNEIHLTGGSDLGFSTEQPADESTYESYDIFENE